MVSSKVKTVNLGCILPLYIILVIGFLYYFVFLDSTVSINDVRLMIILAVLTSLIIIKDCINCGIRLYTTIFLFMISFFVLCYGRYLAQFFDDTAFGLFIFATDTRISLVNEAKGILLMIFSQIVCFLSYKQLGNVNIALSKRKTIVKRKSYINVNSSIRKIVKFIMYFGAIFAFIKALSKMYYVLVFGYVSLYTATGALFQNSFIDLFDGFYLVGFYGLLCTHPKLKNERISILLYIIFCFISLLSGLRGTFITEILILVWYCFKIDNRRIIYGENNLIITNKRLALLTVFSVIIVFVLYFVGNMRVGNNIGYGSLFSIETILHFLNSQGGTGKICALTLEYEDLIGLYISRFQVFFAPVKNFIINNSIVSLFTGGISERSVDTLGTVGMLSSTLTYITNKNAFMNGGGIGTSYVAECYYSGGLPLLFLFSIVLGKFINTLDHTSFSYWGSSLLLLNATRIIIYLPRTSALRIIPECIIYFLFIVTVRIILGFYKKR